MTVLILAIILIIIISIALIALKSAQRVQSDQTHSNPLSQQLSTDQNSIGQEHSRSARPRMKMVRTMNRVLSIRSDNDITETAV